LIHHTPPLLGRRTVSSEHLAEFLKKHFPHRFATALSAYNTEDEEYFETAERGALWKKRIEMIKANSQFNETQIRFDAGLQAKYVDQLFEEFSQEGFRSVAIKHGKDEGVKSPIRGPDNKAPRLTRQMSRWAKKNKLPKPLPKGVKRRFFRTWVRAVPR
jgi:hypothetical protein